MQSPMQSRSHLTGRSCGTVTLGEMPAEACRDFFECPACAVLLRPRAGDSCVFCSYGAVPRPPVQAAECCCARPIS